MKIKIVVETEKVPNFILKVVERQRLIISYLKGEIGIEKLKEKGVEFVDPFKK